MSYSLSVYSINEHLIAREELRSQMEKRGWLVAFTCDLNDSTLLDSLGTVKSGMVISGWKANNARALEFNSFLARKDMQGLWSSAFAEGAIFSCELTYTTPYNADLDWDEEELDELEESDEEYVQALRRAKVAYEVTSGKRSGSIAFSREVWRAIGELIGGLLDDAQRGEHEFSPKS